MARSAELVSAPPSAWQSPLKVLWPLPPPKQYVPEGQAHCVHQLNGAYPSGGGGYPLSPGAKKPSSYDASSPCCGAGASDESTSEMMSSPLPRGFCELLHAPATANSEARSTRADDRALRMKGS